MTAVLQSAMVRSWVGASRSSQSSLKGNTVSKASLENTKALHDKILSYCLGSSSDWESVDCYRPGVSSLALAESLFARTLPPVYIRTPEEYCFILLANAKSTGCAVGSRFKVENFAFENRNSVFIPLDMALRIVDSFEKKESNIHTFVANTILG